MRAKGAEPASSEASWNAQALLTNAEMAKADRAAAALGQDGAVLMDRAGQCVVRALQSRFSPCRVTVLSGPGNNGGDGFVVARLLHEAGWPVRLGFLGEVKTLPEAARLHAERWAARAGAAAFAPLEPDLLDGADLVVDALFGAGLARPLEGKAAEVIGLLADSGLPVVAVDVPSGLDGDSGKVLGHAAPARLTVTFFRRKPGHLLLPGRRLCGETILADIGIPGAVLDDICPKAFENGPPLWLDRFPWPGENDHKYSRGHLVIGGGAAMTGAARLAARAAMRIGAGLVGIACVPEVVPIYAQATPGLLIYPMEAKAAFGDLLADPRRNAVLLGPGYGVDEKTRAHVLTALSLGKRVCLDADALSAFAGIPGTLFAALEENRHVGGAAILTPHEGEFSRLFPHQGSDPSKAARAREAARLSGAVILLKGADTVIAHPDGRLILNAGAPPTLATAGSGDVLAGMIAGLLAQGVAALEAGAIAAWCHGEAARAFGPGLIAEDLPDRLPQVLARLERLAHTNPFHKNISKSY